MEQLPVQLKNILARNDGLLSIRIIGRVGIRRSTADLHSIGDCTCLLRRDDNRDVNTGTVAQLSQVASVNYPQGIRRSLSENRLVFQNLPGAPKWHEFLFRRSNGNSDGHAIDNIPKCHVTPPRSIR